jgi:hypothetical protein
VKTRKSLEVLFLTALVILLGYVAHTRGLLPRLRAAPATLDGRFLKEEAWIVDEIVRDITEMSAYPAKSAAVSIQPRDGIYDVALNGDAATPVVVDLRQDLWSPAQFSTLARAAFGGGQTTGRQQPVEAAQFFRQLVDLTPGSLVAASAAVSRALAADIHDWRAHESAALVLGAFALRESAGRFNDTRWAMNRMTAHLAVATALRGDGDQSDDGRLAESILLIFAHHQTRVVGALDTLAAGERPDEMRAWTRALRLRLTGDLRSIDDLAHRTPLEQLEYFRAARAAAPRANGTSQLDELGVAPTADWLRIIEASGVGVEDGGVIDGAMTAERAESNQVFQRLHGGQLPEDWIAALNVRASRLVGPAGPQVLPWGAWAEAAQRHIAMFVEKEDAYYRMTIGAEHEADSRKVRLKSELGGLRLFPIATMFWNKGPKGTEGDARLIDDAIAAAVAAPELVSPAAWARLALGTHYERVRRGMPEPATWFAAIAPRVAYEAARRIQEGSAAVSSETIAALLIDAPYDNGLASRYLSIKFGQHPPVAEVRRVFAARLDYDIRAVRAARALVQQDAEETIKLSQDACRLSPPECIALGSALIDANRDSEAAASYERAFADPALDAVALSNSSDWLVNYYYRHGRRAAALALAERASATGAYRGLVTVAHLYERLGRAAAAEDAYRRAATGYDNWSQLIGFYYRAVNVRHEVQFEDAWKMSLARVFPNGLTPVTTSGAHPDTGAVVTNDSPRSRKAGLQAGDIVVGLEGWSVSNYDQYAAINAFFDREDVKLTAWRGHLFTVEASAPNRLLGVEYRSYPVRGWAEK